MKTRGWMLLLIVAALMAVWGVVAAQTQDPELIKGAMLYDDWITTTGQEAPEGNMPIWGRQETNTRSGADTWRCVSCHGWDYLGAEGAYGSGSEKTGFPGVYEITRNKTVEQIAAALKGGESKEHDFSPYLDEAAINNLALFLKDGLVDDRLYIDPVTRKVIGGDSVRGAELYEGACAVCHGAQGDALPMRFAGQDAGLSMVAKVDPWRFLHKTRFGTPGTDMVIGADMGWTASEGRDVLLHMQNMPDSADLVQGGSLIGITQVPQSPPGTSSGIFAGLATAFAAMISSLGFVVLLGVVLVGVIFLIVWSLR